jgi:MarR family transcriptional regulator for hemolysin
MLTASMLSMNADKETEFAGLLGRVSRRWRTRLDERLRHLGLTQARWQALFQLERGGPLPQRQLAESLNIEGPTLVRLLDGLESQGLIERRPVKEDRRLRVVHLTPAASPLLAEINQIAGELRRELLAGLDEHALAMAVSVLSELSRRLDRDANG